MRWRNVLLTACSAIALASCGGEEQQAERRVVGPSIPADVAERLATHSDRVAAQLEAGDACGAREEAAALRSDLNRSVDEIPELYLEDLSGLVNEIAAQIPACDSDSPRVEPPPIDTHPDDDEDEEKHKDKDKGKGKGKNKDKGGEEEDD